MRFNIEFGSAARWGLMTVLALLFLSAPASVASAQTATCVSTSDSSSLRLRSYLRMLVASNDQSSVTMRNGLALATMDSNKVVVMADARICPKILTAVDAALQTPNVSRTLRVYSLGKNFAAFDNTLVDHAGGSVVFLDSKYALISIVAAPSVY